MRVLSLSLSLSLFHPHHLAFPVAVAISPIDGWYIPIECSTKCKLYANNHFRCELRSVSCQTIFFAKCFQKRRREKKTETDIILPHQTAQKVCFSCSAAAVAVAAIDALALHVKCVFVDFVQSRSTIFIIEFVIFGKLSLKRRRCACKFNKVIDLQSADTMSLSDTLSLYVCVCVGLDASSKRAWAAHL